MGKASRAVKIEAYVDAVRAFRALVEAQRLDGKTPERTEKIKSAQQAVRARAGGLNGGEIGKANFILNTSVVEEALAEAADVEGDTVTE